MAFITRAFPLPTVPLDPDLAQPLAFGAGQPVLMLPVRLETRFFPLGDGGADLKIRIYPDKVHVDTHEPALTADEALWGRHYWDQVWRAAGVEAGERAAWRQLTERFGAARAEWIQRALTPLNPANRPAAPVAADAPLPRPIRFPVTDGKSEPWTRAPLARGLPARFWVFGYADGALVVRALGNPIPDILHAGPDPSAPQETIADGDLAVDAGMKWMLDFDEAVKVGMGVRLRLDAARAARGFDVLLVFGVRFSPTHPDGTADLVSLLEAHRYTDGLAVVPPGTPTNNTPEARAGFTATDDADAVFDAQRAGAALQRGDGSAADALAQALGFPGSSLATLGGIVHGASTDTADAGHMNRALWPATWGYFLGQMMAGSPVGPTGIDWTRRHFVDYVRAFGPLPAVRIGRQPYGLLPVTALQQWTSSPGDEHEATGERELRGVVTTLREVWRRHLPDVPRAGRSNNPDHDFAEMLATDGISSQYGLRHVMGETYLRSLWEFIAPNVQRAWWWKRDELIGPLLTSLGWNWVPFLTRATYSGWSRNLDAFRGREEADITSAPAYLAALLAESDLEAVRRDTFAGAPASTLLTALLRHSLLLEYWGAAFALAGPALTTGAGRRPLPREHELPGIAAGPPGPWALLGSPAPPLTAGPLWAWLFALREAPSDAAVAGRVASLLEVRNSMRRLAELEPAALERALSGSLDLCSHRLDAWITSFATRRLREIRERMPVGVLLGGYGWVVNLHRGAVTSPVGTVPAGETAPILRLPDNPGFTHAPSLNQASTVAVLRSGHLTHAGQPTGDVLALDLSSDRVRLAEWLLDGVRQGQPLGALLGYRFERRLQDARLGEFIPSFRDVAPLVARKLPDTGGDDSQAADVLAASLVVDGLRLHERWQAVQRTTPGAGQLPALFSSVSRKPDAQRLQQAAAALQAELGRLDDTVDAVSDALVAESVHQAVMGNPLRTASTLDAVGRGDAPAPELDVARTPRTGVPLTYRVVALVDPALEPPAGWPAGPSPRADAEPLLNAWVGRLLGDPRAVRCRVERRDEASGAVSVREIRLPALGLAPIDYVHATLGHRDGQPSEIELRIVDAARREARDVAPAAFRVLPGRGEGWASTDVAYGEFSELLRAARAFVTSARAIDGRDLALPETPVASGVEVPELRGRADGAEQALRDAVRALGAELESVGAGDLDPLRAAIQHLAQFGIAGALPRSAVGGTEADRQALGQQGQSVLADAMTRIHALDAMADGGVPADDREVDARDHHVARLRAVFGDAFLVLPRCRIAPSEDLERALADSATIQGNDPLAVVTWFERCSRVREGLDRLGSVLRYAEALGTGEMLALRVAQLPYRQHDRWVALPVTAGGALSDSRFSLVVQQTGAIDLRRPVAGLLIDEWVEVVPSARETTGLVFQYDQPDAQPPQALLLAVPPDRDAAWNLWSMQQVLLETLDLARLRAVDPALLGDLAHYLPAVYVAANAAGDAVSADFTRLT